LKTAQPIEHLSVDKIVILRAESIDLVI
jgi:hypothetical protein